MNASAKELQIVSRPAFRVVGLLVRGKAGDSNFAQLWDKFGPMMNTIPGVVNFPTAYGVCKDMDTAAGEMSYMAAVEVSADAPVPAGMVSWDVPAADYAVLLTTLPKIMETFAAADQVVDAAGYNPGSFDLEVYPAELEPMDPQSTMYIYIPVTKR